MSGHLYEGGGNRVYQCEDVLEFILMEMKNCRSAEECRSAVTEVLALVKEKKFERLREELGVLD